MFQKLKSTLEQLDAKTVGVFIGQAASKACTLAQNVKDNPAVQSHLQKAQDALKHAQEGIVEGWQKSQTEGSSVQQSQPTEPQHQEPQQAHYPSTQDAPHSETPAEQPVWLAEAPNAGSDTKSP